MEEKETSLDHLLAAVKGLDGRSMADVIDLVERARDRAQRILDAEVREWMDAAEPLEPYDWGGADPMSLGEPVRYIEGLGATVEHG